MSAILSEFKDYPQEKILIGEMLLTYGEIEFALMACIAETMGNDGDTSARILFRVRGEDPRLEVADAIIRPAFRKVGLEGKWSNANGAVRLCKNIRNQYAHCHWQLHEGQLWFMNLDAMTQSSGEEMPVTLIPVELDLIQYQHAYFEYALDWLYHLQDAYPKKAGRIPPHDFPEPKSVPAPPLYRKPS
jgi:hypothetical protein